MQLNSAEADRLSPRRARLAAMVVILSSLAVVLAVAVPPHALLSKADLVGYAICHRIPERSFFLGGRQLPLCARCTGTFLGAMLGLAALLVRRHARASRLPPPAVLGILVGFLVLWAFDGVNSYLTFFPNAPHLYEPQNWLRMSTGMLNGLALIVIVVPVFNFTLWREPSPQRVIDGIGGLAVLLPAAALIVLLVQAQIGFLLFPVALISSLGVLVLLVLTNALIAAVILGREGHARSWRQTWVPLVAGLGLAVLEIAALDLVRDYLTSRLNLPF